MKTIRLLYPDHLSGGLDTYYFGAGLLAHLLPENDRQPLLKVPIAPPDGRTHDTLEGIYARSEVTQGIKEAAKIVAAAQPDKIITLGGCCLVSLASFDYLHGRYDRTGIIWIDAHPDVSTAADGYPYAHAMVLGALLGQGEEALAELRQQEPFGADELLYVGLQELHDYQENFLKAANVAYSVQTEAFVPEAALDEFLSRFDHILIHLDIDVLDAERFSSTYFANEALVGDGSGGGKMTLDELSALLAHITARADVVGLTIAEYLPFSEHRLHKLFQGVDIFHE